MDCAPASSSFCRIRSFGGKSSSTLECWGLCSVCYEDQYRLPPPSGLDQIGVFEISLPPHAELIRIADALDESSPTSTPEWGAGAGFLRS
jgi:hypothetical protein